MAEPADADHLPLTGRTVAVTAERRADEQADLFRRRGARVHQVPTVHTVDLTADRTLEQLTRDVIASPPDWTVATTGFGMRLWFESADAWGIGDELVAALGEGAVVARGPKARSACRQRGLDVVWHAPRESMPEVVDWMRGQPGVDAADVVLQLFDPEDHPTTADLEAICGSVRAIPVYRWRLPDDEKAVEQLITDVIERRIDAVTFTSQPAVRYLFEVAARSDREAALAAALDDGVLPVCIGPVCAEALTEAGVATTIWPEPFRLVPMVKLASERLTAQT